MTKILVVVIAAVLANTAIAQTEQERLKEQQLKEMLSPGLKTESKWTLTAKLAAESIEFDSLSVGSNEIHGLPSYKKCMQLGFKIASLLNEAVAETGQQLKQANPAQWGCREDQEVLAGQ